MGGSKIDLDDLGGYSKISLETHKMFLQWTLANFLFPGNFPPPSMDSIELYHFLY